EKEKRLKEKEIQQQESLVTEGTTLEACLVTEDVALEACLIAKGITMDDNLVAKESTDDSSLSEQLDECNSSMEKTDTVSLCSDSEEQHIIDEGAFERAFLQLFEWPMNTTFKSRDDFQKYMGYYTHIFKETMIHDIAAIEKYLIETILQSSGTESENSSLETTFSRSENEHTSFNKESSSSEGNDADADIGPSYDNDTMTETDQTLRMLLPKEDNVNTRNQGLGFENQNDDVNPSLLNKAKELAPCLYNIDEIGNDLLSDHKIISEEELKCKAEKRLKV
ncbi:hypothetical protein Tco_0120716, partial [Tanacetum coccineum]